MKVVLFLGLAASMASVILSSPRQPVAVPTPLLVEQAPDQPAQTLIGYPGVDPSVYPNMLSEIQPRANLFNLSAYLNNANRPTNGTALTFVPLITLLSAFFTG